MHRTFLSLAAGLIALPLAIMVSNASANGVATAATAGSYTSPCHNWRNWTLGSENSMRMSSDLLKGFRAGRQTACDRLVFVLNGDEKVGYYGAYGKVIMPNGSRLQVAGPVDFQLVVRAWPKGWNTRTTKDDFAIKAGSVIYSSSNPKGLKVVNQVKSAGAFEGETTFAIGLDKKTQWRLFTTVLADGNRALIVEFAHSRS